MRRLLSYAGSALFRMVFPIPGVRDFTCGYRAYRASVLRRAVAHYRAEFVNQEGFQCMVDILLKLSRMHLRFDEIPITLRYDRKGGQEQDEGLAYRLAHPRAAVPAPVRSMSAPGPWLHRVRSSLLRTAVPQLPAAEPSAEIGFLSESWWRRAAAAGLDRGILD